MGAASKLDQYNIIISENFESSGSTCPHLPPLSPPCILLLSLSHPPKQLQDDHHHSCTNFISTANPNSFTSLNAFNYCSANNGQVTVGTPNHKISKIEFRPQCDTNPPNNLYAKMSTCGIYSRIVSFLLVRLRNPLDKRSSMFLLSLSPDPFSFSFCFESFKDHRNLNVTKI